MLGISDAAESIGLRSVGVKLLSLIHISIAVMCSLLDNDLIDIKSIGGVCAANLLGRFCHIDESIMALVKELSLIHI